MTRVVGPWRLKTGTAQWRCCGDLNTKSHFPQPMRNSLTGLSRVSSVFPDSLAKPSFLDHPKQDPEGPVCHQEPSTVQQRKTKPHRELSNPRRGTMLCFLPVEQNLCGPSDIYNSHQSQPAQRTERWKLQPGGPQLSMWAQYTVLSGEEHLTFLFLDLPMTRMSSDEEGDVEIPSFVP